MVFAFVRTLLYIKGAYSSYNRGLYGEVLSFAVCLLFLPLKVVVLSSLHYKIHYANSQNKENLVFFAIFSQKSG